MPIQVPNMSGDGRLGPSGKYEVPFPLGDVVPAGFDWSCLRAVQATLTWTNGPDAGADLYVGLEAPSAGISATGFDHQQLAGDGEHSESVQAAVGLNGTSASGLADGLTVVVYTDWASLSANGLPATLAVQLSF
jgi:hypothetical protein